MVQYELRARDREKGFAGMVQDKERHFGHYGNSILIQNNIKF